MIPLITHSLNYNHSSREVRHELNYTMESKDNLPVIQKTPLIRTTILNRQVSQEFDYTIQWNSTNIVINESIYFSPSTSIIIDSCNISLLANNNTAFTWELGSGSQLEIRNSFIFRNSNSTTACYMRILGGSVIISDCIISDLGSRGTPGFSVINSAVLVENSKFLHGFTGFYFTDCYWLKISDSYFEENIYNGIIGESSESILIVNTSFESHPGSAILLKRCKDVNISFSQFSDVDYATEFQSCNQTTFLNNSVKHFGVGVKIQNINGDYGFSEDALISNNSFYNGTSDAIYIDGEETNFNFQQLLTFQGAFVLDNNITQVGRFGIRFTGVFLYAARNTITSAKGGIYCGEISQWLWYPAYYLHIRYNQISYVEEFGIKYNDYSTTFFEILSNNISHSNGIGISFYGEVGGTDSPAIIAGNIINSTVGAGIDGQVVRFVKGNNYRGHFLNVHIFKNAFLNCQGGFSRFDVVGYSVLHVKMDNGIWGNYWDGKQFSDQDNNMIGDNYFSASVDWGLVDRAPLLSLDLLKEETIGSTHPRDITMVQNEKHTIQWSISPGTEVEVFFDDEPVDFTINSTIVNVDLLDLHLSVGTHNVTLQLSSSSENSSLLYHDLVWLHVDPDLSWMNDLVTIIQIVFGVIIAIGFGTVIYIRQIIKRRVFRKQFAVEFRGIIDISEAENNLREARNLE